MHSQAAANAGFFVAEKPCCSIEAASDCCLEEKCPAQMCAEWDPISTVSKESCSDALNKLMSFVFEKLKDKLLSSDISLLIIVL